MPFARTVMGKKFEYSGTLESGITVFFTSGNRKKISPEIIRAIRDEIRRRSPVRMGANRAPLVPDSIGETLALSYHESPQVMSYVLPLLIEEGFCTVSGGRPYVIYCK